MEMQLNCTDASMLVASLTKNLDMMAIDKNPHASLKELLLTGIGLEDLLSSKLQSGGGQLVFEIGLEEDGTNMRFSRPDYESALNNLTLAANRIDCDATVLFERMTPATSTNHTSPTSDGISSAPNTFAHVLIRKRPGKVQDLMEIRICVTGNVDSGKSTLLGVIINLTSRC
jgi:GTPase